MQNFEPKAFIEAWKSGRDLQSEVANGSTDEEKIMKEIHATVEGQEGFRPTEEQWEEIQKALSEMVKPKEEEKPKDSESQPGATTAQEGTPDPGPGATTAEKGGV